MKTTLLAGLAIISLSLAGAVCAASSAAPVPAGMASNNAAATQSESLETTSRRCPPFC